MLNPALQKIKLSASLCKLCGENLYGNCCKLGLKQLLLLKTVAYTVYHRRA